MIPNNTPISLTKIQQSLEAEAIINHLDSLHYGDFWGITTRILYVFISLMPLILLITGFIMFWHRRKLKSYKPL